jgi:hypothetical protein
MIVGKWVIGSEAKASRQLFSTWCCTTKPVRKIYEEEIMMTALKNFVAILVLAVVVFAPSVLQAQDQGSMEVGKTTITVGTGLVYMMLPDTKSMVTEGPNNAATHFPVRQTFKFSEHFNEAGWNVNGSISMPVKGMDFSLKGFWANVKGKDSFSCTPQAGGLCVIEPLVDDPNRMQTQGIIAGTLPVNSKRDVDYWGIALESKKTLSPASQYLALGLDVRGIYQDLNSTMSGSWAGSPFIDTYKERLNTTYYGAYFAWGGYYAPSLFKTWGLESSFRLQGGIYYANTDYHGRLINSGQIIGGGGDPTSRLSLSRNDPAFIGGLALGISKRLGARTKLSLNGGYEYYSLVTRMTYNTADQNSNPLITYRQFGTEINKKDGSSLRVGLVLAFEL